MWLGNEYEEGCRSRIRVLCEVQNESVDGVSFIFGPREGMHFRPNSINSPLAYEDERERLKLHFSSLTAYWKIQQHHRKRHVRYASLLKDAIFGGLHCIDAVWF